MLIFTIEDSNNISVYMYSNEVRFANNDLQIWIWKQSRYGDSPKNLYLLITSTSHTIINVQQPIQTDNFSNKCNYTGEKRIVIYISLTGKKKTYLRI